MRGAERWRKTRGWSRRTKSCGCRRNWGGRMRNAAQRDAISQVQERENKCRWRARKRQRRDDGERWGSVGWTVERRRAEKRLG